MKFFFNHKKQVELEERYQLVELRRFWTEEMVRMIPIYPYSEELNEKWLNSSELSVWPVYDTCGYSGDFIECKDKNQAYNELLYSLNNNLYERYHDL